jgi:alkylated DNA nucleotide flippase Atl1
MVAMKFHEKLSSAPEGSFHVLDPAKAARLKGGTLYIPSPSDVKGAIDAIPRGEVRTLTQLRDKLAKDAGAEVACVAATTKYWKWLAFAAELEGGAPLPWWRVTKEGKAHDKLPGGAELHRERLRAEGTSV